MLICDRALSAQIVSVHNQRLSHMRTTIVREFISQRHNLLVFGGEPELGNIRYELLNSTY